MALARLLIDFLHLYQLTSHVLLQAVDYTLHPVALCVARRLRMHHHLAARSLNLPYVHLAGEQGSVTDPSAGRLLLQCHLPHRDRLEHLRQHIYLLVWEPVLYGR